MNSPPERLVANLVRESCVGRRRITLGLVDSTRQCLGVSLLAPQCIDREVAGGAEVLHQLAGFAHA
jgi:hypothetical protein